MNKNNIIVIGSTNTDMVIKSQKFPLPGETLLGGEFFMNPGGKGANQAVAAARLGGKVTFIAKIGDDIFGQQALQQFQNEGIDTQYVFKDSENPSGVALITVDGTGENTIVVASGANGNLLQQDINAAHEKISGADVVLIQLEIPLETVDFVVKMASRAGKKVILNPAPAQQLPEDIFQHLYLFTPNETEAETYTGVKVNDIESAEKAAIKLKSKGIKNVVITLGSRGAFIYTDDVAKLYPAPKVEVVDSTAAGDIFNGALAVSISKGNPIVESVQFAIKAASLSVTRYGAQASAPYANEV